MYGELRNKDNKKIREKEYYEMLQKELEKRAGEDTEISFRNVRKNNGVYKKACTIRFHDAQIAPTVYLEPYYNHYLDGQAVAESADNILNYCRCSTPDITVPDNFFKEYSTVKGRLGIKLIGKERNEAYLREVPHIDRGDLAGIYYYLLENKAFGNGMIVIRNTDLERWGITTDRLYADLPVPAELHLVYPVQPLSAPVRRLDEVEYVVEAGCCSLCSYCCFCFDFCRIISSYSCCISFDCVDD